jgi:fructosamine-3-kinase
VTLPDAVRSAVEAALEERVGRAVAIGTASPVGGGCISPTARVETDAGDLFFLKWGGPGLPDGLLAAEAAGLRALADADAVRVPGVVAGGGEGQDAWLILEWLEPGRAGPSSWETLGRNLAALHQRRAHRFGAEDDNFIGALPQANAPADDWPEFWRTRRLEPQVRAASDRGLLGRADRARFDALYRLLDDALAPAADDGPSLLHGDLWNGNVHVLRGGEPALIDPAIYHGHREVDLAMAELFGGFAPDFLPAYDEAWPLLPGRTPRRRAIYQLYYLLVHVNLFGASYLADTRKALAVSQGRDEG